MNPITLVMIILSLIIGSTIAISGYHWMAAWLGLEMNTLAIIPLMVKTPNPRAIEAATKYFLVQAAASALILFSSILNAWMNGDWVILTGLNDTSTGFFTAALAMKLGMAPFHFWLPDVLQGLTLPTGLILSTWQKLPPIAILVQLSPTLNLNFMLMMAVLSIMIGGWGGINQTQLRKILAYSSIAHLGWVAAMLKLSPQLALFNFMIYVLMTSALFLVLITIKAKNLPQLVMAWPSSPTLVTFTMLALLSLAGLPPLTGFMPKWMATQEMVKQHFILLATIMLLSTLLSLFFYMRLVYTMTLTMLPNLAYSMPIWHPQPLTLAAIPITLSIFMLALLPLIPPPYLKKLTLN
uniref:NADH-ubiquinone oxidoreductase chain 2 n=1 Tax=Craugastor sartori TaxID=228438 RepID=Q53ED5_9NEOB|nr:NADH dehydrogenase subunit II [Craugastor sartori]